MEEKALKLVQTYEMYAKASGFKLNPEKSVVDMVVKGLLENEARHGARYCPCRIISGDKAKDRKNICPCAYHKEEIAKYGHCHCRLFVR